MDADDRDLASEEPAAAIPEAEPAAEAEPVTGVAGAPEAKAAGALGAKAAASTGRLRTVLERVRGAFRLPRSRRGVLGLLLVIGALSTVALVGAIRVVTWTETADFCGRCHTMGPELVAHEAGPHRDVTCGECHVEPGVEGWIRAKLNGTRQLVEIVLGTFPEPIPPPDHDNLPPPEKTCLACHSLERVGTANLVTRTQYTDDEANTRQFIGLFIRPGGGDVFDTSRSVHWHVLADVEYRSADPNAQTIDWIRVTRPDGLVREFIAKDEVRLAEDVRPDIERLAAAADPRRMDCLDCHNRIGHPLLNPRREFDAALSSGRIDRELPYIKREGMRILWSSFASEAQAEAEAERLRDFYALRYPRIAETRATAINQAIEQIKVLYRLTATPEMRVTAKTYPDNLGHTDFIGCFRCHDGGHYRVKDGALTDERIPSSCDTCHTFPQIGGAIASPPLGIPPETHDDRLFVFNHRNIATSVDPGGISCGECHARDYCSNCHETGAVTVGHDEMLTNHAAVIRESGANACAYCHQPVYCALCHTEPVLPGSEPVTGHVPTAPDGIRWPLIALADRR